MIVHIRRVCTAGNGKNEQSRGGNCIEQVFVAMSSGEHRPVGVRELWCTGKGQ